MRGGVSYISHRHSEANSKYMKKYDDREPSKYVMYLDANNLYGWAISQRLPTSGFRWMTEKEIAKIDLTKYKKDSKKGLILEVDLEYLKELHDMHNDYPLAQERMKVTKDTLSTYCETITKRFNISIGQVQKLIPTLNNNGKYVLHYQNLKQYLNLGLKSKRVHGVLQFNQSPWLRQYINFNTEKRKNVKTNLKRIYSSY